jgi:predicted dehydrogenase
LVEKPISLTLEDADKILEVLHQTGSDILVDGGYAAQ